LLFRIFQSASFFLALEHRSHAPYSIASSIAGVCAYVQSWELMRGERGQLFSLTKL
jgi:hypothetical protein